MPRLGYEQADGSRGMDRFVFDDSAGAVLTGQDALEANRRGSARAVLVIDAYVQLDTGRTDALITEAVRYGPAGQSTKMAVPIARNLPPGGVAVCRPRLIEVIGVDGPDYAALGEAFFAGAGSHEPAAVRNAHLDQTG